MQTGSSSKLFTLITALEQGVPFGYRRRSRTRRRSRASQLRRRFGRQHGVSYPVVNSSPQDQGTYSLYTGTTDSINVFFAQLEQKVGLCNVVHTAADLGMTRADGKSLLSGDPYREAQ